jgi:hypothetical protein
VIFDASTFAAEALAFFRDALRPATLTKRAYGARTPGALADGPAITETHYDGLGLVSEWLHEQTELVKRGDRVVVLFAEAFEATPAPTDTVEIEGVTYTITGILTRDAGAATYTCAVRR